MTIFYFYSKTNQMYNISILFWNNILHVSDGFSVYHEESKTVHTVSDMCRTSSVVVRQLATTEPV